MKKMLKIACFVICMMLILVSTVPACAKSGFKTVHSYYDRTVKSRTVNGTIFTTAYIQGPGYRLTAEKNGKEQVLSENADAEVVSDGNIVYYSMQKAGNHYLYKANLKTGKKTKIKKLGGESIYSIDLAGIYKNDIYYVINSPEGTFAKVNVKTKKIKKLAKKKAVTSADMVGSKFVLADGTGAGYSYVGLWDAAKNRYVQIAKEPFSYRISSKYVDYVQTVSGDLFAGKAVVSVKRYYMKSGKTKTLAKNLKVSRYEELTAKHFKYYDDKGNLKTAKW